MIPTKERKHLDCVLTGLDACGSVTVIGENVGAVAGSFACD